MRVAVERVSKRAAVRILEKIGPKAYMEKDAELIDLCALFLLAPSPENALAILGNICTDAQYLDCLDPPIEGWEEREAAQERPTTKLPLAAAILEVVETRKYA